MTTPETNLADQHFPDAQDRGLLKNLADNRLPEIWFANDSKHLGGRKPSEVTVAEYLEAVIVEKGRAQIARLIGRLVKLSPEQQTQVLREIGAQVVAPMGTNLQ